MGRLNKRAFPEQDEMTKDDYVIICGDFGIWDDSKREKYNLDWLEDKLFTTLFVDGNHENYDILDNLPVSEWHNGKVHFLRPSVIHLMRGKIYDISGKTFFTFGGASSHDIRDGVLEIGDPRIKKWRYDYSKQFRINHVSWWERELPSEEEMQNGWDNLEKSNNKVDFIVTHSPCTSLLRMMDSNPTIYQTDRLTDYLQKIKEAIDYRKWFFGHMHVNQNFDSEKSICLYEQIIRIL
nr:metallophosphoesterase [Mediterraneibacter hominis]